MQIEADALPGSTILWFDPSAAKLAITYDGNIMEEFILPSDAGLIRRDINMTAFYARFGSVEFLPPFAEFIELPLSWFLQPAERVVDFLSSVEGLTIQDRVRFSVIIALCHNCARYKRITGRVAPIARDRYVLALLNEPSQTIIPIKNR
jgi:hypothetical protein